MIGASVLSYTLSSSFFGGSGSAAPTLTNPIPTPSSAFVDLGTTSASAPLGTFGANNFVGFSVPVGNAITLGSVEVNIPADFLGEFILTSTSGEQFASIISNSSPTGGFDSLGTAVAGTNTVGTGTVVPEPSSFLFLGLVGTAALGMRRYRRQEEELEEVA